jgi:long-chain acyl-CoA synthetase
MPTTLVAQFAARIAESGPREALFFKRDGAYVSITWDEYAQEVRRVAAALVRLGVKPGDRVIHLSKNRYEWVITDLAIQLAQGVQVPVHALLTGSQIAYQILDSDAVVAIISGPDQAAKLVPEEQRLAHVKFVSYDACDQPLAGRPIPRLWDLAAQENDADARRIEAEAIAAVKPEDLTTILYTSGTTGEPKGVMLSQWNLASNVQANLDAFPQREIDRKLNWLPLSHIFARTCDLYFWIAGGSELAIGEGAEHVLANCAEVRPTVLTAVPYFYEKVMRYLTEGGRTPAPGELPKLLGGRMRFCCSGGAALPDHIATFFCEHGAPLGQGYGLTESSPVISINAPDNNRVGTSGKPAPGVEVKIADDGEILCRGPLVMMGYWKRPDATAETIRDGWLHTGDLGELDPDGYLKITGRKKELIVTSAGKNIAPVLLEALLTADPWIAQAMVIGDGRSYLTALIVPNVENLKADCGTSWESLDATIAQPEIIEQFDLRIKNRLREVSRYEQVCKFRLVPRAFSIDSGELTPTLKLRRGIINKNYAAVIEELYVRESCPQV